LQSIAIPKFTGAVRVKIGVILKLLSSMLANPLKEIAFYKYKIVPGVAAVDNIFKLTL